MATRIYKDPADFDARQGHFTIEVVDRRYYLRIGALNSEDRRLIGSLIDDGFVGFFQDDVRIGIAGIVSTYDAENDRIEIDSELPELQIEDEYVIRFTQSRPGEDGDGGIGTPGEDGEHAEIEIEDTDTGIRVRGKSGGEPAFGPWQDVRDGIDGQAGKDGDPGEDGEDGEHAEIEIEDTPTDNENAPGIRVRGRSGGETDFSEWHYVQDGKDGQDGIDGEDGEDGEHAEIEVEDTNTGIRVRGKSGGEPAFGPWHDVRDGIDGEDGRDGTNGTGCKRRVIFSDHDGSENTNSVILPEDYTDFDEIYISLFRNYTRIGKYSIATLQNATNPRVQGVTFTFDTITRALRISGTGNFREIILLGCDEDASSNLILKTRGELIATSSFLPQNLPGSSSQSRNLDRSITWTLNTTNYHDPYPWGQEIGQRGFKAHPSQGRLAIPYRSPVDGVLGMWAVTEDLANPNENPPVDAEVCEVFIPWGLQQQAYTDATYFRQRFVLQFGYSPVDGYETGEDVVLQYYRIRQSNYKHEFNVRAFGNTLPSAQCRIKIYLAGIFITTETE